MVYVFLIMILLHIIDDFVLQPICLSKLKQKSFWETYVKDDEKYKFDYKVALVIHALSWSIMIHLPLIVIGVGEFAIFISVILNTIMHAWTDDEKANKLNITLFEDQLIHLIQIGATWVILTLTIY